MDFELFPNEKEIELMNKEFSKILSRNAVIKQEKSNAVQTLNGKNIVLNSFTTENNSDSFKASKHKTKNDLILNLDENITSQNYHNDENQEATNISAINAKSEVKTNIFIKSNNDKKTAINETFLNTINIQDDSTPINGNKKIENNTLEYPKETAFKQNFNSFIGQDLLKESINLSYHIIKTLEKLYSYSANYTIKNEINEIILTKRLNTENLKKLLEQPLKVCDKTTIQTCKSNFIEILQFSLVKQRVLLKNFDILNNQNIDNNLLKTINMSEIRMTFDLKLL